MIPTNRPLIEAVIKNMAWWQQAVQDIGWRAIFLAVSVAESDKDVNQRLAGFKTEQEFVDYISSILSALYDAKKDAEKLLSLKEDLRDAQTTANLYEIYSKKLEKKISMLKTIVTMLIRALPRTPRRTWRSGQYCRHTAWEPKKAQRVRNIMVTEGEPEESRQVT